MMLPTLSVASSQRSNRSSNTNSSRRGLGRGRHSRWPCVGRCCTLSARSGGMPMATLALFLSSAVMICSVLVLHGELTITVTTNNDDGATDSWAARNERTTTRTNSTTIDSYNNQTTTKDLRSNATFAATAQSPDTGFHQTRATVTATTAASLSSSPSSSLCYSLNTKEWLLGDRHGNAPLESNQAAMDMILAPWENIGKSSNSSNSSNSNTISFLLEQSLCHATSRLLRAGLDDSSNSSTPNESSSNPHDDNSTDNDNRLVRLHTIRLLYLAFYIHQHEPARDEALHRLRHSCFSSDNESETSLQQPQQQYGYNGVIGNFDYQCPSAKFLVVPLTKNVGLGATLRLIVVNALLAGMATRRVVMFVSNLAGDGMATAAAAATNDTAVLTASNSSLRLLEPPWPHASCDRRDWQCTFLPMTPCVLTVQELRDAHVLTRGEQRQMFGDPTESVAALDRYRVVVAKIEARPHKCPDPELRHRLVQIVKDHVLTRQQAQQPHDQQQLVLLERAMELIFEIEPEKPNEQYYYFGHRSKVHHAAVLFAMRPRPEHAKQINAIVANALPKDFNANVAMGLPIRASDKCLEESECLSFEQYMKVMASMWQTHLRSNTGENAQRAMVSIVLTTEDERVMDRAMQYYWNSSSHDRNSNNGVPFPFRFITNRHDVMQGTGVAAADMKVDDTNRHNNSMLITADQVMLSSLTALKLQLSAKHVVGNCCSNFHALLFDLFREECGLGGGAGDGSTSLLPAETVTATCLQELNTSEFNVCCAWDKSERCVQRRASATKGGGATTAS